MKKLLLIILSLATSNVALAEPKIQPIIQNKYYTSIQEPNNSTEATEPNPALLEEFSKISADSIWAFFDGTDNSEPQATPTPITQPSNQQQLTTPTPNPVAIPQPPNIVPPTSPVPAQQTPTTIQNYGITPIPTPPPALIPSNTAEQPSTPQPIKTLPPNPNTNLDTQQPPNPPKTSFWKRFTKSK